MLKADITGESIIIWFVKLQLSNYEQSFINTHFRLGTKFPWFYRLSINVTSYGAKFRYLRANLVEML